MPKTKVYNTDGEQVGEIELDAAIFAAKINKSLLFDVSQMLLAGRRRGTASTKNRGEVRGGGRKPWQQKGTGRARHGSIRSPIWTGGGVTFGPKPRRYSYKLPKKARRKALCSALSSKFSSGKFIVLDSLMLTEPKTKKIINLLNNLNIEGSVLLVTADPDINVFKSGRNIPGVTMTIAEKINVLDILDHDTILLTREAAARIEEVFANEKSA